jgi:hypothetical protein
MADSGRWVCDLCGQTLSGEGDRCNSGIHQGPDDPNGWRGRAMWCTCVPAIEGEGYLISVECPTHGCKTVPPTNV